MKFTKLPVDTFKKIQLNAGILLADFAPATGTVTQADIIGATSGGINFTATPNYSDFGEDIDNCPKNTKELKKLDDWTVSMSGTFVAVSADLAGTLTGAQDSTTTSGVTKIVPRADLDSEDFDTLWWVGDYSDENGETNGGFIAIKMINALSTGGFQIQSSDKAKGSFSFEFTGHYSINDASIVPFEIYVKTGTAEQ